MKGNCFVGDTKVMTSFGEKDISSVKEGEKIMTRQGYRKAVRCAVVGYKKVSRYNIIFEDKVFVSVVCTDTQRFFTDLGDVPARYLEEGMYVHRRDADDMVKISFISREEVGIDFCYDIEVADEHEYYANGLLVKSI